jgi:hypothetical protein
MVIYLHNRQVESGAEMPKAHLLIREENKQKIKNMAFNT